MYRALTKTSGNLMIACVLAYHKLSLDDSKLKGQDFSDTTGPPV